LTLNSALKEPGVADLGIVREADPDPVTWLERSLRVSLDGSEFIRVELDGPPEETVQLLGAVAKAYLAAIRDREDGSRRTRLVTLEKHLARYREEADQARQSIDTIANVLGAPDGWALAIQQEEIARRLRISTDGLQQARMDHELARLAAEKGAAPDKVPGHRITYWQEELLRVRTDLRRIGEQRLELEKLQRRVAEAQAMADRIAREIEEVRVNLDSPSRVTLAEEAYMVAGR
jgi:hypothetical protein